MTKVYLVTNDGSGEDGDEWLLGSIHATKDGAEEAKALGSWYRCVEEWEMEGSLLTDAEREAIGVAIQCVEAAMAQRHPEEEEARLLLHQTSATLSRLCDRVRS